LTLEALGRPDDARVSNETADVIEKAAVARAAQVNT
jgi:hypothetical protein